MEHKHKVLVTASSQAQGASSENIIDRFSNLPDEVAHHILSYLDLKGLIRVGSMSKRCRGFSLSTTSLNLCSWYWKKEQDQIHFLNSFDRFLIHRGDNKIKHFSIHLHLYTSFCDEFFRVTTWIHTAVRCNVEVLDLRLSVGEPDRSTVELPSCIFLCGSLRSLLVDFRTILKVPSFVCSTNLQCLDLRNVRLDEGFSKWVSHSCKCIKKLQLDHVSTENITVESSSLESFKFVFPRYSDLCQLAISGEKLVDIHIEWGFYKPGSRSLNIFAPSVKYLKWIGEPLNHHDLGKLTCLEKAEIFLKKPKDYEFDDAFEVLCSMCRVKVLILSEDATKVLSRAGSVAAPFDNISHLSMHILSLNDELVPSMVSLLRGMPNLTTLCICTYPCLLIYKPKSRGFNRRYWKSQNLAFVHQLKEVTIELSHAFNGLELARYILEHAPSLKKMVLFYLSHQSYVIRKVNESKKVSTATVVLQERQVNQEKRRDNDYYRYLINFGHLAINY